MTREEDIMSEHETPHPLRRASDYIPEVCQVTHEEIERRLSMLETAVEALKNRPPVWATAMISILSAGCGALVTHLLMGK